MIPNQWYAVLNAGQVKQGSKPIAFKRLNQDMVFWRTRSGKVIAMTDSCPHRQAKLSLGKVVDDNIQCAFHGFQYDTSGMCQLIPANGKNGPRPKVFQTNVFEVREEYGFIWVWHGEPQKEYPKVDYFDNLEGFAYATISKVWNNHYTRAIENLLDMAHLPFVHRTTIGRGNKTLVNGPYTTIEDNLLSVWGDNVVDNGELAIKPSDYIKPNREPMLSFKFPNIWQLNLGAKHRIMIAFAPIDEKSTMMYSRTYGNMFKNPLLRKVVAQISVFSNLPIMNQDQPIVESQPRKGGFDSGDKYIPADRPIVMYYQHRDKLIKAALEANEKNQDTKLVDELISDAGLVNNP